LPGALEACRRAVELAPDDWSARGDLALVLFDAGALEEAAAHFDRALARAGDAPALVIGRAKLDLQCGERARAIAALEACVQRNPSNVGALATLALALRDERRFDAAIAALSRAIEQSPGDAALWCGLGRTLLEAGRASEGLRLAEAFLKGRPGHAGALSVKALSLLGLGDESAASRLLDYDRWVAKRTLPVPEGFADLHSFNEALAAATASHPTLHRAPVRHATAAGLHSGSLMIAPGGPLLALQQTLRGVIDEYGSQLPDWPDHPHVSARPKATTLEMWCVVMQSGGHQVPHVHPDAWLSGVYYPQVPEAVSRGQGPAGCLVFGEPDRSFPGRERCRSLTLRPEAGMLVLFPSYFFHHTIPFEAEGTRISVAFDVVPVA
jgi:tetratricopeptide (TPR) repeat protein